MSVTRTFACGICNTAFTRTLTSGRHPKYCGTACAQEAMKTQQGVFKTLEKSCELCGTSFFTDKWKFKTKKYCSRACTWKANQKNVPTTVVNCARCGGECVREARELKRRSVFYCSRNCQSEAITKEMPLTNTWAGVRTWFSRKNRMSECSACGYDEHPKILVIHHKDRNRSNNNLSNLIVLCPNCHAVEHMQENSLGWKTMSEGGVVKHKETAPVDVSLMSLEDLL